MSALGHKNFQTNISSQSLFLHRHGENFRSPLEMRGSKSSDDEKANKIVDDVLEKILQREENPVQTIDRVVNKITKNDKNGEQNILKTIAQQKEQDAQNIAQIHERINMLEDDGPHLDTNDLDGIEKLGEPSTASFNPKRLNAAEITDIQKHLAKSFETTVPDRNHRSPSKKEAPPQPQAIQVTPPKNGFLSRLAQKPWAQGAMKLLGIATLSGALNKEAQARPLENKTSAPRSQLAAQLDQPNQNLKAIDSLDFKAATDFQFPSASKKETGTKRKEETARGIKPPTFGTEPSVTLEPVQIRTKEALAAKGSYDKKQKPETQSVDIADIRIDTKAARAAQANIGEKSVKAPPELAKPTLKKMSPREIALSVAPVRRKVKELNLGQQKPPEKVQPAERDLPRETTPAERDVVMRKIQETPYARKDRLWRSKKKNEKGPTSIASNVK